MRRNFSFNNLYIIWFTSSVNICIYMTICQTDHNYNIYYVQTQHMYEYINTFDINYFNRFILKRRIDIIVLPALFINSKVIKCFKSF